MKYYLNRTKCLKTQDISTRSTAIGLTKYINKEKIAKYIKDLKTVLSKSSSNESEKKKSYDNQMKVLA